MPVIGNNNEPINLKKLYKFHEFKIMAGVEIKVIKRRQKIIK